MMFLKITSILFLVLSIGLAAILVRLFGLRSRGVNFADLAFPMLLFAYVVMTGKAYAHSYLPFLGVVFSIMGLVILVYFLRVQKDFTYKKYFKFFWRAGFLVQLVLYVIFLIDLFLK